jgi:hypothetical protein
MTRPQRLFPMLLAPAILFALAWQPTAAHAQISLSISPATVTAMPGATGVSVFGTLTNSGTASVDLDDAYYNLLTGPAGADLTSAISFSDYSAPFTLTAGQSYSGALFTFDTQPDAPVGDYTGNFAVSYGGQATDQTNPNFTVTLQSAAVPEASTTVSLGLLLALGLGGMVIARKRTAAVKAN